MMGYGQFTWMASHRMNQEWMAKNICYTVGAKLLPGNGRRYKANPGHEKKALAERIEEIRTGKNISSQ